MLLIEALLVLQEVQLPGWFLPHHTAHDVVSTMHRLFPAFMNGCRCINTAFHVERKAVRVEALEKLAVRYADIYSHNSVKYICHQRKICVCMCTV